MKSYLADVPLSNVYGVTKFDFTQYHVQALRYHLDYTTCAISLRLTLTTSELYGDQALEPYQEGFILKYLIFDVLLLEALKSLDFCCLGAFYPNYESSKFKMYKLHL